MPRAIWLAALLAAACGSPTELDDRWADPARIAFATTLNVNLAQMNRTNSGLFWRDLTVGDGDTARVSDQVRVHLTGWLPDGTEVQTTRGGDPVGFTVGYGAAFGIPQGVDEGVIGMRIGGIRQLVVKPSLAYGNRGYRVCDELGSCTTLVPPLTTLVYEVERRPAIAK